MDRPLPFLWVVETWQLVVGMDAQEVFSVHGRDRRAIHDGCSCDHQVLLQAGSLGVWAVEPEVF